VDSKEWYFEGGYTELFYTALVIAIFAALYFFARRYRTSRQATSIIEENTPLLGLVALAIILFIINRLLGDLW
jgi:heme/copper-type cytochrome/quinol oxidase subunit 2